MAESWVSFSYGVFVSLVNIVIQAVIYFGHKRKVSRYPSQALVVVVINTVTRLLAVVGLLLLGFRHFLLSAEYILLGFVLGQVFFLIHQLWVTQDNGK